MSLLTKLYHQLSLPLLITVGLAFTPASSASETSDRELFLKAEKLAKIGRFDRDSAEAKQLESYPLYPYLLYNQLSVHLDKATDADISEFTTRYPNFPLEALLRYRFTEQLGKRKEWDQFLTYYDTLNSPNDEMQCYYGLALFSKLRVQETVELAQKLWQAGESRPDECDPLFRILRSENGLTSEIALNRVLNALENSNFGLSGYALKFVKDDHHKRVADAARSTYRSHYKALKLGSAYTTEERSRIQRIGLSRAYRKSPYEALDLLIKLGDTFDLTDSKNIYWITKVGVRVAKELKSGDAKKLADLDPTFASSELTEWRIRLALMDQKWNHAADLINQLPKAVLNEDRWRYWHAILPGNQDRASILADLSNNRSFYGFLAANILGEPANLNHQSAPFDSQLQETLKSTPPYVRIQELLELDRYTVARSEWNSWTETMSLSERHNAAHLMQQLGWHQQGILAAAFDNLWNDMELRFPVVYQEWFKEYSARRKIDPIWSHAIARQESALFPWARSSAGARGLMQLMPRTAKRTAKSINARYLQADRLYEPEYNILLGTAYLGQMYKQFKGNRAHATAAYNAGPHRVNSWLKNRKDLPLDVWIEIIPFDETRTYVQNVLSFAVIYSIQQGNEQALLTGEEKKGLKLASR